MSDRDHIKLLIDVARAYYVKGDSQADIASSIGYSRSMVSRMLQEAKDRGIVTITIDHPLEQALDIEKRLKKTYGLDRCLISASPGNSGDVARLAADLISELTTSDTVLAMTNGSTMAAVGKQLRHRHRPHATVVQALGALAQDNQMIDSPELCRIFAERLGTRYQLLSAPLVVGSTALAQALRHESTISMTISMAAHADVLLTSVGATTKTKHGSIFKGLIRPEEHASLIQAGCVGHICAHHIDARGRHMDNEFCSRLITLPFERLHHIPNVIVVAWGSEKAAAVKAALLGGFVNTLVTDLAVAEQLLDDC